MSEKKILVFVEEGLGNILQAVPTLIALNKIGYTVDVALRANYPGMNNLLHIPEINQVFNMYIERIPNAKDYEKVILTMFGHLEHYKYWKEDFEGIPVMQDIELSQDIGKMNDVEVNFRFARELGYEGAIPDIKINYPDNSSFQYFDNIICPGSGGENKRWPYFMDLAKRLKGRVGIVGGPNEEKVNWPPNCVDMTGLLSLEEISSVISKAGVYIGNDSGITHLANATKVPCVVIWGPTNLIKCKPWNNPTALVTKKYQCQPCMLLQGETKCEKEQKPIACLYDLKVSEVLDAVDQIIECSDYRSEEDFNNYWELYKKKLPKAINTTVIDEIKDVLENHGVTGNTCLDYGCGTGDSVPVLNHYFKKIDCQDIIDYSKDIPKLNGVSFNLVKESTSSKINKTNLLFLGNSYSWIRDQEGFCNRVRDRFDHVLFVDIFDDKNKLQSKKQQPLNIKQLENSFNITIEESRDLVIDGKNIKILLGKTKWLKK